MMLHRRIDSRIRARAMERVAVYVMDKRIEVRIGSASVQSMRRYGLVRRGGRVIVRGGGVDW